MSPVEFYVFTGTPHPNGLKPGTEDIVDRDEKALFHIDDAVAVNSSGTVLKARGTPAFDGDLLIQSSQNGMSDDEKAFHRVMAIMFPIRNALMYDIADLSRAERDVLVTELEKRKINEKTFTEGAHPKRSLLWQKGDL